MSRMRGFTLIELMVTLVVLAIVVGVAVPNFSAMIRDNRSVALADELVGAVNYARSQAITAGGLVSLCASSDGTTCGSDWTEGWIVFTDGVTSATVTPPVVSAVLRHWQVPANATITVAQNSTPTNFIRFTNLGTLAGTGNAAITSQIEGCTGNSARNITINRGGVARAINAACNNNP